MVKCKHFIKGNYLVYSFSVQMFQVLKHVFSIFAFYQNFKLLLILCERLEVFGKDQYYELGYDIV
jgi:hypothetical protein